MATYTATGFDDLCDILHELGTIPEDVISEALVNMGNVATNSIRKTGISMDVRDPESGVHIMDKLSLSKPKASPDGGSVTVTFKGSRKRGNTTTRNAEIAFVNEFGKQGQAARPFMKTALTKHEAAIAEAGARVIGEWQEKTFEMGGN